MKVVSKFQVSIFYTFLEVSHKRTSWSGRYGSGRAIILNDSTSPKMVIKIYFNFFNFFSRFLSCFNVIKVTHI